MSADRPIETARARRHLAVLAETAAAYADATADYRELVGTVVRRIAKALDVCCAVGVVDESGTTIAPVAFHDEDPEAVRMLRAMVVPIGIDSPGPLTSALATGAPVVALDLTPEILRARFRDADVADAAVAMGLRSTAILPLRARGTLIGALTIARHGDRSTSFDAGDLELAVSLAGQAALAIANARLFVEQQRLAERLAVLSEASRDFAAATGDLDALLGVVARRLVELLGDFCLVRLLIAGRDALQTVAVDHRDPHVAAYCREVMSTTPDDQRGLTARVIDTGASIFSPVITPEEIVARTPEAFRPMMARLDIHSFLAVPLQARGEVLGVVAMGRAGGAPYTSDDLRLVEDLATHAALAINNARSLQSARRELSERERAEAALKLVEDQLRQSQKLEAIGRLAGGVAHDFNNMLTVILSYPPMMRDGLPPNSPLREDLAEIERAGERAAALTRQLLAFGRRQVIEPEVLDLGQVVRGVETLLRRLVGEGVRVRIVGDGALGRVRADPGQLEQVLVNLAANARDAMPEGGTLTVETANVELDEAYAREHLDVTPGAYVMLAVSDTGHGMDRETRERIFEPFYTTKERGKGTGLGLATVFGIVKQSQGHIWVYSEVGRGTVFKIHLPRTDAPVVPPPTREQVASLSGAETVLLVEDDAQVRVITRGVLQRAGYTVLEAADGDAALAIARAHGGPIPLLLSDVVMAGMGGPELARTLVRERPDLRVLFMSGYTEDAIPLHGVLAPGAALISKPLTPDLLLRRVRAALDEPRR